MNDEAVCRTATATLDMLIKNYKKETMRLEKKMRKLSDEDKDKY